MTEPSEAPTSRRELLAKGAVGAAALGAAAVGASGAAAAARKPNIVVLMTDQERYPQWTPKLPLPAREFLDSRGVSFERFYHSAVPCSPSRSTFWTGMSTSQTGIFGNFLTGYQYSMAPSIPTIGDLMKAQGYTTAFFGKWHLSLVGPNPQDLSPEDLVKSVGRDDYLQPYGFDFSAPTAALEPANYRDGLTNDPIWAAQAVDWLKKHGRSDKPYFMVVSLLNPHDISYFPRGFTADFKRPDWGVKLPLNFYDDPKTKPYVQTQYHQGVNAIAGSLPQEDKQGWLRLLNIYADLIVGNDEMLGHVIKAVHGTGRMDDTVIIRTADHGELAGSHKLRGKGPTMYEEQVRMPFVVSWPKRFAQNVRTPAVSEAVDLLPTCLELAGVGDPISRYPFLRGKSLVGVLEDPARATVKEAALCSCDDNFSATEQFGVGAAWKKHMRALLTPRFKFARYHALTGGLSGLQSIQEHLDDQDFELYDLRDDPYELRNLARDPAYKPLLDDLLAWQAELEKERYAKLDLPAMGTNSLIWDLAHKDPIGQPRLPVAGQASGGLDIPLGGPGTYVQVPFEDPGVARLIYEIASGGDDATRVAKVKELERARVEAQARVRATMLCDLMPAAPDPRETAGQY